MVSKVVEIQMIPLGKLKVAKENVRKEKDGGLAALKASLAAHGLFNNLVVQDDGKGGFLVIAGGRRHAAFLEMAKERIKLAGEIVVNSKLPIPCQVMAPEANGLTEISLAENMVRLPIHPADQVVAFSKMEEAGLTVKEIATRFGITNRLVEQRLRLARVYPPVLDGYRRNIIDLETFQAFTLTEDHERQKAVWENVKDSDYGPSVWRVKSALTDEHIAGNMSVARFVGVEDYEKAGGKVSRDLFAEEDERGVWFEDIPLVERVAMDKLNAAAEELRKEGWKWVDVAIELGWDYYSQFGRAKFVLAELTEEERGEKEKLHLRQGELHKIEEDDWTEEIQAESEAVEKRLNELDAIPEERGDYEEGMKEISGCAVSVHTTGSLRIECGLIRKEDMPEDMKEVKSKPTREVDAGTQALRNAGLSNALAEDLSHIRTTVVKKSLQRDFKVAFDLFLFELVRDIFPDEFDGMGYVNSSLHFTGLRTLTRPVSKMDDDRFGEWNACEKELDDHSHLALEWCKVESVEEGFEKMCALPAKEKQALFAACVARMLEGQLSVEAYPRANFEAAVRRLKVDFAKQVKPHGDLFWARLPKAQILLHAEQYFGSKWTAERAKLKKGELVEAIEEALAGTVKRDAKWLMPGFAALEPEAKG